MSFSGEFPSFSVTILDVRGLNQNSRDSCCGNRCKELRYIKQLVGNQLGVEQSWRLEAAQEQERTEQAQLQTKRGTDAEAVLEDQLEDENKEVGEEKKRALYELKKQPS
ncbi:hypothetical protein F511_25784 [Dorcoceras hygrometricum]|uniref:Uncharacterized protein n=1 Tax=Dorcoceras hygrometricum TaxID=472368 RepID=A0A2Z7DBM8_9LAMI|nr:hypothetical protein F511_25784 [Dorcoceras hygrometricum]